MSKRLQILLPDAEMEDIRRIARREHISVGEWARRALRSARSSLASGDPERKLKLLREAAKYSFPTGDIDQMSAEIERGYLE
ncbi:MAG: antitoxin [Acidobacteriia bacterium]|nr:antitoxin [Terriglobia bacterium]